jgi:hypothetical protein
MLFSPQGVHGMEQFEWMILPATVIIYFNLFYNFAGAAEFIRPQLKLNFLILAFRDYTQYFGRGLWI